MPPAAWATTTAARARNCSDLVDAKPKAIQCRPHQTEIAQVWPTAATHWPKLGNFEGHLPCLSTPGECWPKSYK